MECKFPPAEIPAHAVMTKLKGTTSKQVHSHVEGLLSKEGLLTLLLVTSSEGLLVTPSEGLLVTTSAWRRQKSSLMSLLLLCSDVELGDAMTAFFRVVSEVMLAASVAMSPPIVGCKRRKTKIGSHSDHAKTSLNSRTVAESVHPVERAIGTRCSNHQPNAVNDALIQCLDTAGVVDPGVERPTDHTRESCVNVLVILNNDIPVEVVDVVAFGRNMQVLELKLGNSIVGPRATEGEDFWMSPKIYTRRKGNAQNERGGATLSSSDGGGSAAPERSPDERAAVVVGRVNRSDFAGSGIMRHKMTLDAGGIGVAVTNICNWSVIILERFERLVPRLND